MFSLRMVAVTMCMLGMALPKAIGVRVSAPSLVTAVEGAEAGLPCGYEDDADFGNARHVVLWQKYDADVKKYLTVYNSQTRAAMRSLARGKDVKLEGNASLVFSPVNRTDEGMYRCQVTSLPNFRQGEATLYLEVTYGPEFLIPTNTTILVDKGRSLNMSCAANAKPRNITYHWIHQGKQIHHDVSEYSIPPNLTLNGSTVTISGMDESTEGVYSCFARNDVGTAKSQYLLLQKRPAKFLGNETSRRYVITEGKNVTMIAEAKGVPDNITYSWRFVNASHLQQWKAVSSGEIALVNVTRNDAGVYECIAMNGVGQPALVTFALEVQYRPQFVETPEKFYSFTESSPVLLRCEAEGNPRPEYEWRVLPGWTANDGDLNVERDPRISVTNETGHAVSSEATLQFEQISRKDAGTYACIAKNGVGEEISVRTVIDVTYAPELTASLAPTYEVSQGGSINLTCSAIGNPKVMYSWYRGADRLLQDGKDFDIFTGTHSSTLKIKNSVREHEGVYRCEVANSEGMSFSETTLFVKSPPTLSKVPETSDVYATLGSVVRIHCTASGRPMPNITWRQTPAEGIPDVEILNGTRENTKVYFSAADSNTANGTLEISDVTMLDYGLFKCIAENEEGRDEFVFKLRYEGPPLLPTIKSAVNITTSTGVILWKDKNQIGSMAETHFATIENVATKSQWEKRCADTQLCLIGGLKAGVTYSVSLFGSNSYGNGTKSNTLTFTTLPANPVTTPDSTAKASSQDMTVSVDYSSNIPTLPNESSDRNESKNKESATGCILVEIKARWKRWRRATPCTGFASNVTGLPVIDPEVEIGVRKWACADLRETPNDCSVRTLVEGENSETVTVRAAAEDTYFGLVAIVVALGLILVSYGIALCCNGRSLAQQEKRADLAVIL